MAISKATARWEGTLKNGNGTMQPQNAAVIPFSFGTRFDGQPGSNPEEVIGAALAGCFSMALSVGLEKAGATPRTIETSADVSLDQKDGGFAITRIQLTTRVAADGIDEAAFQKVASETKNGCPVSKALAAVETIALEATLQTG